MLCPLGSKAGCRAESGLISSAGGVGLWRECLEGRRADGGRRRPEEGRGGPRRAEKGRGEPRRAEEGRGGPRNGRGQTIGVSKVCWRRTQEDRGERRERRRQEKRRKGRRGERRRVGRGMKRKRKHSRMCASTVKIYCMLCYAREYMFE